MYKKREKWKFTIVSYIVFKYENIGVILGEIFNNTAPFDAWDKKQMQDISDVPLVIGKYIL